MPIGDNLTTALIIIGLLVIAAVALGGLFLYQATPTATGWTNIIVSEKYAASSGYLSYTPASIVSGDGIMYQFNNDALWARLNIGGTYKVKWYIIPGSTIQVINAVTLNGTIYYG